jgi:cytochrome c biogenesis protein CcmG/thiol:disulfide interchange protein DsbE
MWRQRWNEMTNNKTYYELLEIPINASDAEVITAAEAIIDRYRSDMQTDPSSHVADMAYERIGEIEAVRDLLLDPKQRDQYDRSLGLRIRPHVDVTSQVSTTSSAPVRQELVMVVIGALIGIVIVAIVWMVSMRMATPNNPAAAETNRPAPDFVLARVDGGTLDLRDLRGKVVVVNFWGTWCAPCIEETPAIQAAYEQLQASGVEIVGINLRHQEEVGAKGDEAVRSFVQNFGVTYPIVLDADGEVARLYQISPIPTSYFIDAAGNIRYVYVGTLTAADIVDLVNRLQ